MKEMLKGFFVSVRLLRVNLRSICTIFVHQTIELRPHFLHKYAQRGSSAFQYCVIMRFQRQKYTALD